MPRRPQRTFERLAQNLRVKVEQVSSAAKLFDEGNSVPFVARYRQEITGCLSDTQLRQLHSELEKLDKLEERRESVVKELTKSNHLTDALRMEIDSAESMDVLEEIHQPFKTRKVSKATLAREAGMEPLARRMLEEDFTLQAARELARGLSLESAMEQARNIIAEDIARVPDIKSAADETLLNHGRMETQMTSLAKKMKKENAKNDQEYVTKVKAGLELSQKANDPQTYEVYFNNSFSFKHIKPHQILAVNRAEKLGFLVIKFNWSVDAVLAAGMNYIKTRCPALSSTSLGQISPAVRHGVKHLLKPSAERRMRRTLTQRAVVDATATFSRNLWSLLLAPPLVGINVLGVDPGFKNGCKLCVCNPQGTLLHTETIYPHRSTSYRQMRAQVALVDIVVQYKVKAIALGDGVASRETESFMYKALESAGLTVGWSIVSEDGASVYSASELAAEELPEIDVALRGAVSIARRLQDPLGELVKIDPCHLGIGLYQHDIKRSVLKENLRGVVESAVNTVGVDINTASAPLLAYVAGLSPALARNIVQHRMHRKDFTNRMQILDVRGIGKKIFQQCAGFLRIRDGENALDNTSVHPESYHVVHQLLEIFYPDRMVEENVSMEDLQQLREVLLEMRRRGEEMDIEHLAEEVNVGVPTLKDIVENVLAPGRDVRGQSTTATLKWQDSSTFESLHVGDKLSGTVKNVVEFGAFVDINTGCTGLVHVKQMRSDAYASHWIDPHDVCKVGDKVSVEVVSLDAEKKRVSLKIVDYEL